MSRRRRGRSWCATRRRPPPRCTSRTCQAHRSARGRCPWCGHRRCTHSERRERTSVGPRTDRVPGSGQPCPTLRASGLPRGNGPVLRLGQGGSGTVHLRHGDRVRRVRAGNKRGFGGAAGTLLGHALVAWQCLAQLLQVAAQGQAERPRSHLPPPRLPHAPSAPMAEAPSVAWSTTMARITRMAISAAGFTIVRARVIEPSSYRRGAASTDAQDGENGSRIWARGSYHLPRHGCRSHARSRRWRRAQAPLSLQADVPQEGALRDQKVRRQPGSWQSVAPANMSGAWVGSSWASDRRPSGTVYRPGSNR